ncbi:ornithine cyclodeaminase family protein [Tepidamorphus sp. 3E244]|uniref:ornithine cyclodeaminase family protein n=1 Tax=Tepidamorphus sp. 3E244 TaxID=3385498 RepID=UPI0038FC331B
MAAFHYLSDDTLEQLGIDAVEIADRIEQAVAEKARDAILTAPKSAVLPGDGRYMMSTLATADAPPFTAVKTVTVSPDNPGRDLPAINGAISLFDSQTGLLKCVMEAGWVTAVRTAGLSAVAARKLADPNAQSVGFIGCGVQARSHLDAFRALFPLKRIKAYGRGTANVERLCAYARDAGLEADVAESPRDAISDVDLIVTSVTLDYTIEPFLDARWVKGGAFAAITDLGIPWMDETMSAFGQVFVDDTEQEAASPKKVVPADLVNGDLTDLVSGKITPKHDSERPATFVFRGLAIGDFAIAALGYERAVEKGLGTVVGA